MRSKKTTPKHDVCTEPAYLFWKLQSRLSKLTTQLAQLDKQAKPTEDNAVAEKPLSKSNLTR